MSLARPQQQRWTLWQRGRGRWSLEIDPRVTDGVGIELQVSCTGERTVARWCLSGSGRVLGRVESGQA